MNLMLQPDEKVRMVTCIIWLEEMSHYNADNPLGGLLEYLEGLCMPIACSPLHDQDTYDAEDVRKWIRRHIDPKTGEVDEKFLDAMPKVGDQKKAHVHIIFESKSPLPAVAEPGKQSWTNVFVDYGLKLECYRFERVPHPDSLKRYLCHLDSVDKHRYPVLDIHTFGGIKMGCLLRTDDFVKENTFMFCMNYAIDNKYRYYSQLLHWALKQGDYEVLGCVRGNASTFVSYFNSQRQMREDAAKAKKAKQAAKQSTPDFLRSKTQEVDF